METGTVEKRSARETTKIIKANRTHIGAGRFGGDAMGVGIGRYAIGKKLNAVL